MLTLPAATIMAIGGGHTLLAQAAVFACVLLYTIGYRSAAARYRRRMRDQLAAARRDALTGLPIRAVADELLDAATREATPVTVALADVDGLKAVNTDLGHAAGDQYIQIVARRLALAVPPGGCLVRQGGDELFLLTPELDADVLAGRIGAAMVGSAVIGGYRVHPRASVGVAESGGGDATYARACADAAMFSAKAVGGNHTLVYDPARDGRPQPDGTRPLTRRRDIEPLCRAGLAWSPTSDDDPAAGAVVGSRSRHCAPSPRHRW